MMDNFDAAAAQVAGGERDPFDVGAERVIGEQRTALRASLYDSLLANPDVAARAVQLGRKTGLPADLVERNLPQVQRDVQLDEFDRAIEQSPRLAQWLSDPTNARLAHDDIENLAAIEQSLRYASGKIGGPAFVRRPELRASTGPEPSLTAIARGLGVSFVQGAERARQGVRQEFADLIGSDDMGADASRKFAQAQSREADATPEFETSTARGLYGGGASLLRTLPGLAASLAARSPTPMLAAAGLQTQSEAYGKYRVRGGTPGEAALGSIGEGVVEVATELLPMSYFVEKFGKVGATQFIAGFLGRELPSEQVATFLQDAIDTAVANPEKTWDEYWAERPDAMYQTFLATLVQSGVLGAANTVALRYADREALAQQGEQSAAQLAALSEVVKANKVRARDASSFQQFIEQAAEDGPVDAIYIDGRVLMQSGLLAGLAQVSPAVAEQAEIAAQTGGQVRIPVAEYAATIAGTELEQPLLDHLKTDPDMPSRAEAQEFLQSPAAEQLRAEVEQVLAREQADAAFQASAQEVEDYVFDQLKQTGRLTDAAARTDAALHRAFASTMAAKLGMTPSAFFDQHLLRVVAGQLREPAATFAQDGGRIGVVTADTTPRQDASSNGPAGATSAVATQLLPRGAAGVVSVVDADQRRGGSGDVYLMPDGRLLIDGVLVSPGDTLYLTDDKRFVREVSDDDRAKISTQYASRLNRLIAISEGINRTVSAKPLPDAKDSNSGDFLSLLEDSSKNERAWEEARYPSAGSDIRTYKWVDSISPTHDPEALEKAMIEQVIDENMKFAVGGFLHVNFAKPLTPAMRAGLMAYEQRGGRLGRTAFVALGDAARLREELLARGFSNEDVARVIDQITAAGSSAEVITRQQKPPNEPSAPAGSGVLYQSANDLLALFDDAAIIELGAETTNEEALDEQQRRFLSAFPEGTRYKRDTRLLKRVRRASDAALDALDGNAEAPRDLAQALGPFSEYSLVADILPPDDFNPQGQLSIRAFGKEQIEAGLDGEPALTITVTADGELTINGPAPNTPTFEAFRERGWADYARGAGGQVQTGWSALKDPARPDTPLPLPQILPLLADAHARVREWRGQDYVGLHWTRATGALGGLFSQDESAVFFQDKKGDTRDLIVQHNLTAANLLHAQKMGGIPVPSLAITKKDTPLQGFGEITLLGSQEMADPKGYAGTKVFGADIYSPRYPSVEFHLDAKARKKADALVKAGEDATGEYVDWQDAQREGPRVLETSAPIMWQFLKDQGIEPKIVRVEGKPLPDALQGFAGDNRFTHELAADPAFAAAAWQAHEDMLVAANGEGYRAEAKREIAQMQESTKSRGSSNTLLSYARQVEAYRREQREAGKVDARQTKREMEQQIAEAGKSEEFARYAKDFLLGLGPTEKIFRGFTNAGNRKHVPHTLDNVVKILKQELRGGENFNYGVGSLRAKFTPQFKSIEQIRKSKDRLLDKTTFEQVKSEIDAEFWAVLAAIDKDLSSTTGIAILEDAARMGVTKAAKGYGFDVSPEAATKAAEFLTRLRELPTEYFEAKILREVDLAEFSGAVVPEGADQKVIDALKSRGVKDIRFYKKGDEADRAAKIGEFENLFFQDNRGSFSPATNTIALLKNADLSTFLHESGHYFLEVMLDVASQPDAPAAIQRDAQILLDWYGVKDLAEWNALDFEEQRSYHEKFARGFEAYLLEGKAPSFELQPLFQRFRAWLLALYKSLKALNVDLTPEVRGVMDRMLATDEQIALAEQSRSMLPIFENEAEAAKYGLADWAAYQALGEQATADAIDELQARGLRDMQWLANARARTIKKLQKQAGALRAEVEMEVRREVMARPVYQAWAFLTGKAGEKSGAQAAHEKALAEWKDQREEFEQQTREALKAKLFADNPDAKGIQRGQLLAKNKRQIDIDVQQALLGWDRGNAKPRAPAAPAEGTTLGGFEFARLDLGALVEIGLPREQVELLKARRMVAKDGLHPDLVAELPGVRMSSGDELVRALVEAPPPKEEIAALTDQRMLERYGDLATPEAIERAADKAIHNEARAKMVATEANALAKAVSDREQVGTDRRGRPVMRPVAVRAARDFARAMVARLKVRDIKPSQYAAAEARAARAAEKAKRAGDIEAAAAEKRNQLIQVQAARAAHDAIDEIDGAVRYLKKFGSEGTRKGLDVDYLEQIDRILERFDLRRGQSAKAIDKRTALARWLASQEEAGFEPDIPEWLQDEARRTHYKNLTLEELRGVVDSVKQIEHIGRLKKKLLTAKDQRELDAIVGEIARSLEANSGGRVIDNEERNTFADHALHGARWAFAAHRKAAYIVREMDGFRDGGPLWNYFIRPMNEAGDREATMRAEATAKLYEIAKPILAGEPLGGKGKFYPGLGRSFNRGERLAVALNWGNEGNRQRLLGGKGWTDAQMQPVLQSLTAADWQFVQGVWDFFESYRPQIAAKERRVYGKEPEWIDPAPFRVTTADGQQIDVRGGYYPIKYDPRQSGRAGEFAEAEDAKAMMRAAYTAATTRRSFTKSRAEEVSGRPLLLSFDGIWQGANEVIHDITWHEWLIDANRLLRRLDSAMRTHYGAEAVDAIKKSVKDTARGDVPAANHLEKALNHIRAGATITGLGWNVTTALLQPFGITQSMVRVGPAWIARGLREFYGNPLQMAAKADEIQAKSEFMKNRARTMQREINEIQNQVVAGKGRVRTAVEASFFVMIQKLQATVDYPTWLGAYEKAIAENPADEARAVSLADQAVIDAQGGGQIKDLSEVQRGHPAWKLFTNFYSFFNVALNLGIERTKATDFKKPGQVAALAGDYLLLFTVPAVMAALLKEALRGSEGGGDDEERLVKKIAEEQLGFVMGLFVGLRETTGALQLAAGVGNPGLGYQGPAGLRLLSELQKLGQQIGQGEADMALFKAANSTAGVLFHYPAGQINRTVEGTVQLIEGRTDNVLAPVVGPPFKN